MTISFDAIWIPIGISALGMAWAGLMLRDIGSSGYGVFQELCVGLFVPAIPILGVWLGWALLT